MDDIIFAPSVTRHKIPALKLYREDFEHIFDILAKYRIDGWFEGNGYKIITQHGLSRVKQPRAKKLRLLTEGGYLGLWLNSSGNESALAENAPVEYVAAYGELTSYLATKRRRFHFLYSYRNLMLYVLCGAFIGFLLVCFLSLGTEGKFHFLRHYVAIATLSLLLVVLVGTSGLITYLFCELNENCLLYASNILCFEQRSTFSSKDWLMSHISIGAGNAVSRLVESFIIAIVMFLLGYTAGALHWHL